VIDNGTSEDNLYQFFGSTRISIDEPANTLHIVDHRNVRIQMIFFNDFICFGQVVISDVYFPLRIDINNEDSI
jgi:hypothetical protein